MKKNILALALFLAAASACAESFASCSAKAREAAKRGDGQEAIAEYSNALKLWKKSDGAQAKEEALAARAGFYRKKGDLAAEVADLSRALELDKKNPALFRRRGRAYLDQGNASRAIDDFIKAIALKLNDREAYAGRAEAYEKQGDLKFATEDWRAACKLGLKSACAKARSTKRPRPAALPPANSQAAASSKTDFSAEPDMRACIRGLQKCVARGKTYDSCVAAAPACGGEPKAPCCPQDCVTEYQRAVGEGSSEAESFRAVFSVGRHCRLRPVDSLEISK